MSNDPAQTPNSSSDPRSHRKQQKSAIIERRERVKELYLQERLSMREIAKRIGFSLYTVSEDFAALTEEWRKRNQADISAHVARELIKIDIEERQAQEAYDRSRKPKRVAAASKGIGPMGPTESSTATVVERDEGDAKFLAILCKLRDQRMKLLSIGMDDEESKNTATNFEDYVAMHLEQRQQNMINVTPRKELPAKGGH